MNKEFIPYEQALQLKELGFEDKCLAVYFNPTQELYFNKYVNEFTKEVRTRAPLYQQAFRWFREKYQMAIINPDWNNKFKYKIFNLHLLNQGVSVEESGFETFEEAELACLKKLIEIVKGGEQ